VGGILASALRAVLLLKGDGIEEFEVVVDSVLVAQTRDIDYCDTFVNDAVEKESRMHHGGRVEYCLGKVSCGNSLTATFIFSLSF
jgi:hypothetical protein